jgi:hypothetical protein
VRLSDAQPLPCEWMDTLADPCHAVDHAGAGSNLRYDDAAIRVIPIDNKTSDVITPIINKQAEHAAPSTNLRMS